MTKEEIQYYSDLGQEYDDLIKSGVVFTEVKLPANWGENIQKEEKESRDNRARLDGSTHSRASSEGKETRETIRRREESRFQRISASG